MGPVTVDLARWIGVQLDEDERIARAVVDAQFITCAEWHARGPFGDGDRFGNVQSDNREQIVEEDLLWPHAAHIAAHDPARVLREVDVKRRQVEWCVEVIGDRDLSRYDEVGSLKDDKDALAVTLAVETLRLLAWPYDARPGYRAKWAPTE